MKIQITTTTGRDYTGEIDTQLREFIRDMDMKAGKFVELNGVFIQKTQIDSVKPYDGSLEGKRG